MSVVDVEDVSSAGCTGCEQQQSAGEPLAKSSSALDTTDPDADIPEVEGVVHSIESFSAVDGPGIRFMIFVQGCPCRCVFCCNPDTWSFKRSAGTVMSSKAVAKKLGRCVPYLKRSKGGLTISGGEPLGQPDFVIAMFREAHRLGVTTTIDTTGVASLETLNRVLPHTDCVLLCVKALDPARYKRITKVKQDSMLQFAREIARRKINVWVRFVLIPGMTDSDDEMEALLEFARAQPGLQGIELLPYHRLGVEKWKALGIPYTLKDVEPPPKEQVEAVRARLRAGGVTVI